MVEVVEPRAKSSLSGPAPKPQTASRRSEWHKSFLRISYLLFICLSIVIQDAVFFAVLNDGGPRQEFVDRGPLRRVLVQQGPARLAERARSKSPWQSRRILKYDHTHQGCQSNRLVPRPTMSIAAQLIKNNAECPHITFCIEAMVSEALWCKTAWGAAKCRCDSLRTLEHSSKTKITDPNMFMVLALQKYILALHISMQHMPVVEIAQAMCNAS